ncbi:MAG: hypothetical protein E7Z91_06960 [Cyanobacteria bacterium SIG30]|nr:hypothetical protein [Cyanobacteria bacterium SIG30]
MKISPSLKKTSFSGYDARKIKSVYMQNSNAEPQQLVYQNMYDIGKREGFDVFIHSKGKVASNPVQLPEHGAGDYNYWAQDDKMFINTPDGVKILYPKLYYEGINDEPVDLAETQGIEAKETELVLEGGNIFLGKKDNGDNYLIVGSSTFDASSIYQFLKTKDIKNFDAKRLQSIICSNSYFLFPSSLHIREYHDSQEQWEEHTKELFCKEFDVKKENLHILFQPDFHLDMAIRPLEYPYILVNDEELVKKNLFELEKKFYCSDKFLNGIRKHLRQHEKNYVDSSIIKNQLEKMGFVPIMVSGALGNYKVNFMNAIVNKRNDGKLAYITNSAICDDKRYKFLQDKFEEDVSKACPQIDKFYYVQGAICDNNDNLMMRYLNELRGGIHCLCAEVPDFEEEC